MASGSVWETHRCSGHGRRSVCFTHPTPVFPGPSDFMMIAQHEFPNGLVLVAETMPSVQSAAFSLLLPAGAAYEPADGGGAASMLAEWISRGAGERDSHELLAALDN